MKNTKEERQILGLYESGIYSQMAEFAKQFNLNPDEITLEIHTERYDEHEIVMCLDRPLSDIEIKRIQEMQEIDARIRKQERLKKFEELQKEFGNGSLTSDGHVKNG